MTLKPHNTAITRSKPSVPARHVARMMLHQQCCVLDYGCGKGKDVIFYGQRAKFAAGYDPHSAFGFNHAGTGFDIVTMTYVLNVIQTYEERVQALMFAAERMAKGGVLVVSTRTPVEIDSQAQKSKWDKHGDGYLTSKARGTFQKGIGRLELEALGRKAGLTPVGVLLDTSDTCSLIFKK